MHILWLTTISVVYVLNCIKKDNLVYELALLQCDIDSIFFLTKKNDESSSTLQTCWTIICGNGKEIDPSM